MATFPDVLAYYDGLPGRLAAIGRSLHGQLLSLPGFSAKMRWRKPFYDCQTMVCYASPVKQALELVFLEAQHLQDDDKVLDWRGRRTVAGILLREPADAYRRDIQALLYQAIEVDALLVQGKLPRSWTEKK